MTKLTPGRKIDPIIFKYTPTAMPPYMERIVSMGDRAKDSYVRLMVDSWERSKQIQADYVSLANIRDEAITDQFQTKAVVNVIAKDLDITRSAVYDHLKRVIKQLHLEHPEEPS